MIDHVGIRFPSLAGGRALLRARLSTCSAIADEPAAGGGLRRVDRLRDRRGDPDRPVTRRLHVGFYAPTPDAVDAWWRALTAAGYQSDGEPGRDRRTARTTTAPSSSTRPATASRRSTTAPAGSPGVIDHLWLRTPILEDASRFYEAVCPAVDHTVERYDGRTQIRGSGATFSIVEGPPTENLHLAFEAGPGDGRRLPRAGVAAGFASNGEPGERPEYHAGYYRRLPARSRRPQHRGRLPRPLEAQRATARARGACGVRGCRRRASRRRSRTRSRAAGRRRATPTS